jgi:hypothetical protein
MPNSQPFQVGTSHTMPQGAKATFSEDTMRFERRSRVVAAETAPASMQTRMAEAFVNRVGPMIAAKAVNG